MIPPPLFVSLAATAAVDGPRFEVRFPAGPFEIMMKGIL